MSINDTPNADTMAAARFAAANLRAWADHVEKTGEGVTVKDYAICVDVPLTQHIGMAPLASAGSVGWRHTPRLRHRNRGFGDHGSRFGVQHLHGVHDPRSMDVSPDEPPCPRCTLALYICRCDEYDLRDAVRERDALIEALRAEARCYAVDESFVIEDLFTIWPKTCSMVFSPHDVLAVPAMLVWASDNWDWEGPATAAHTTSRCVVDVSESA